MAELRMPLVTEIIERLPAKTLKGEHRTRTIRHYWVVCDVCGEGTYVVGKDIKKTKADSIPGRKCRMTPRCAGKHRKVEPDA